MHKRRITCAWLLEMSSGLPGREGTSQSEGRACHTVPKPERVILERTRKTSLGFMENMDYRKEELRRWRKKWIFGSLENAVIRFD